MDWKSAYKPERRATPEDVAEEIRNTVTMGDIINTYCPECSPRKNRIPCPIHRGKDYNFSFTDTGYKCFVCGESGDAIKFVQTILNLRTRIDAMAQICHDFRLPISIDTQISTGDQKALEARRNAAREREKEQKRLLTAYHSALDRFTALDIIKRDFAPKTPDDVTLQYVYACKNIDKAWYDVNAAAEALHRFENRQKVIAD